MQTTSVSRPLDLMSCLWIDPYHWAIYAFKIFSGYISPRLIGSHFFPSHPKSEIYINSCDWWSRTLVKPKITKICGYETMLWKRGDFNQTRFYALPFSLVMFCNHIITILQGRANCSHIDADFRYNFNLDSKNVWPNNGTLF